MAEKVTTMILKVDLQCPCCYKKVKKTLCKFPQIRNQLYDEKGNTVTITVVCCSPERIRDKLCYNGGKAIKSITIKDAAGGEKPKPKEAEKPKVVVVEKPKDAEKPKVVVVEKPKEAEKPKVVEKPKEAEKPKVVEKPKEAEKPKVVEKPKEAEKPKDKPKEGEKPKDAKPEGPKAANPAPNPNPPMMFQSYPVNGFPMVYPSHGQFDGHYGVPAYHGFGAPPPPQPHFEGYYGGGVGYEYGRVTQVNRPDYYFSEENPQGCSIM